MLYIYKEKKISKLIKYILFFFVVLIFNAAVIITILTSLKTRGDINAFPPAFFFKPTMEHYKDVLMMNGGIYIKYIFNSFLYSLLSALGSITLCFPAAYAVIRFKVGAKILLPLVANLRILPLIIFAIPIYMMYNILNILDTIGGLVIIGILINIPVAFILFTSFLRSIPSSLAEAARIDGASLFQTLFYIIIPVSLPAIITCAALSFIYSWNEFLFAVILSTEKAVTATIGATLFISQYGVRWGSISAAIVLSILPIAISTFLAFPLIGKGMVSGAVKG